MGEAGGGGGASQVIKDVISGQNGSQDGSDAGNELVEEMEKLQVGKNNDNSCSTLLKFIIY